MIGNVVGNYKVTDKLGEGGMGAVYKGIDLMLEREVAIKALRPELAAQPQVVERFRSEAVTLAKLNHPNIGALYSFFRQGDEFFMVMEFMHGQTLDKIVGEFRPMSPEQAVPLFYHALEGIGYAHRMGIVHRDIKPANMMLTEDGLLKVLDFGIARVLGTARMTRAGNLIGTIEYMSPEQVKGQETDARSDIYSLGMLLYEMLTGRVPFTSGNEYELMRMQVEDTPPSPREFAPDIPPAVEAAIMKAIAKKPEDRFQNAGEFRQALAGSVSGAMTSPEMPVPNFTNSNAPFSKPPTNSIPPAANTDVGAKATRLAPSANMPSAPTAAAASQSFNVPTGAAASPASKSHWKLYAGAGAVAVIVLGAIAMLTLLFLIAGSSNKDTANTANKPSTNTTKPATTGNPAIDPASTTTQNPASTDMPNAGVMPTTEAPPTVGSAPVVLTPITPAAPKAVAPKATESRAAAVAPAPKPVAPRNDGAAQAAAAEASRQRAAAAEAARRRAEALRLAEQ